MKREEKSISQWYLPQVIAYETVTYIYFSTELFFWSIDPSTI